MDNFEKEVQAELETAMEHEMEVYYRIVHFANWLDQGIKVTDDEMLKKVFENYMKIFGIYLSTEEENDEE
jgi:hypothetical protein